jgi:hypothetical protein
MIDERHGVYLNNITYRLLIKFSCITSLLPRPVYSSKSLTSFFFCKRVLLTNRLNAGVTRFSFLYLQSCVLKLKLCNLKILTIH